GRVAGRPVFGGAGALPPMTGVGRCVLFRLLRRTGIGPAGIVIAARFRVVAGKEAAVILGVDIVVADEGGGVGVGQHILLEPLVVGQDIVDEPAEKGDIAAWADRDVEVGDRRGAAEPWVDVDQGGAAFFGLHR